MMHLSGLIAATFTPMHADGSLNLAMAGPIVDHLIHSGVSGLYVCGSTGEGPLLTTAERKETAAAYVEAAAGRLPVVVQVGHSSVIEARELAAHAQQIGANATSAVAPYYFKPSSIGTLVDCLAEIAGGAPKLPFYYYHIPELSGVHANMVELLRHAPSKMPNFAGIKYTAPLVNEFQTLIDLSNGRFDILFGRDEMLLSGLAGGADGAVGSTYNFAAPLYRRVIAAFERGDVAEARRCQGEAVAMVNVLLSYRGHAGLKAAMGLRGLDCGPTRLPNVSLRPEEVESLRRDLDAVGFFR
ncbi:MAG: dihydrodipicolinate synthase family protein [Thermoguttaceae bacterium]|jgi:N-acetylneuraminate lyase